MHPATVHVAAEKAFAAKLRATACAGGQESDCAAPAGGVEGRDSRCRLKMRLCLAAGPRVHRLPNLLEWEAE